MPGRSTQSLDVMAHQLRALIIFLTAACVAQSLFADPVKMERYRVYFPNLPLARAQFERVTAIEVIVKCGEIRGVSRIPEDWWVEVRGPVSVENQNYHQSALGASAGHGATWLNDLSEWNGSIAVAALDSKCLAVSATIYTSGVNDVPKQYALSSKQMKLRP